MRVCAERAFVAAKDLRASATLRTLTGRDCSRGGRRCHQGLKRNRRADEKVARRVPAVRLP